MAGLAGAPVLFGGAIAAYEASARDDSVESVDNQAVDRDGEATGVALGFESQSETDDETFTYLTASSDALNDAGRMTGEQVRVRRGDDEYAVYTVRRAEDDTDRGAFANELARARLDLENVEWEDIGDCRVICPRPEGGAPINDEDEIEVELDPAVVDTEASVEEAKEQDEYVEVVNATGANAIVLSPHGGDVQPHTDEQAETVVDDLDGEVAHWGTRGYRDGGGAFVRWYVPSYNMAEASYPGLAEVSEDEYEYAIAFHGTCDPVIQVGGQAPESFRIEIRDAINEVLEDAEYEAVLGTGEYRVDGDQTLANRLATRCGIWIGQDEESRERYGTEIAQAVADVLETRV
ncbi:poly-gamma-glutamate hydrolase family protein [Natronorubrum daqingense]|nr:poly-gamma-glutamate hydrolase family protein [Natronorubrum daqingense]